MQHATDDCNRNNNRSNLMRDSNSRWVLVAEDDEEIRHLIRNSLQEEASNNTLNLQVVEAKDGLEAISKVASREFHCVVTDLKMPRSTGIDVLRVMQSNPLNANTPTVVVTGTAPDDFPEQLAHVRVVPKPFDAHALAQVILKEIKLGRIDDRVAMHLMNPFLEAIRSFLGKSAGLEAEIQQPTVKKSGTELVCDVHCNLLISAGTSRNRFTLSFDTQLLSYLKNWHFKDRTTQWATMTSENIAKQTAQAIFDETAQALEQQTGLAHRLSATSIIVSKSENEYADLVSANGISIALTTAHGRVVASAFSKPRNKRI